MATKPLPSPEVLRQLLRYEAETGFLFWKDRDVSFFAADWACVVWNGRFSGKQALAGINANGYKCGRIFGVSVIAHRVIWAMQSGEWPRECIDHINGIRTDNRIKNLREATKSENAMNRRLQVHSTSGLKGVSWDKESRKWKAHIKVNGIKKNLGRFHCPREAAAAYNAAAHAKFGEFALINETSPN